MIPKWSFFFVICVLPVLGRQISRKDPLLDKLNERRNNFKFKLYKVLEEGKMKQNLIRKNGTKEMSFDECAEALSNRIRKRKEELKNLSSLVEHVWSSFNTYQISSLKVKGTIKSPTSSVVQSLNLNSGASSLVALTRMNMDLLNVTLGWGTVSSNFVLKSAKQTIKSNLQFMNLSAKQVKFNELSKHLNINYVATDRLFHSTLKNKGNQMLTHKMTVENVLCKTATTRLLNRKEMQDYVLLRPGQYVMTGVITFKNISSQNVYVHDTINDVAVKDMVLTTTTPQVIWKQKTFGSLTAKSIQATYTNGIQNLSSEVERTVFIRNKNVDFISTLNIKGDLHVSFLDDLNISAIFSSMVKKNQREDIRGIKTFKSLEIWGNVRIDGEINGVSLMNIMTIDTNQRVIGNVTFSSIDIYKDVLIDSLNGYNLSSEAVVKSSFDFEIKGVKIFDNDLNVSNITMNNQSRIDFFDPSAEISEFFDVDDIANAKSIRWWVINTPVTITNIVAKSIEVGRNSLPYLRELDNVWLKTREQTITSLNAQRVNFKNLHVSKLNGINITDLVTVHGQDYIDAPITFTEDIFTRALEMEDKAYLNMPPEFWNPDVQVKIEGSVCIEKATVEGNLYITEAINLDFMHAEKKQTVEGEYHITTMNLKDLMLPEAKFHYLNDIDVQKYFESSVPVFDVSNIHNKRFSTLKALELNCRGTLNNVMIDKVVTTNTNQTLNSSYRFLDGASFDKGVKVQKVFGNIGLESVVNVDIKGKVSNKYFNGAVITSDVRAIGTVNGVNVTSLHLVAFSKSRNNYVEKKFTFWGKFKANEINIAENKSVDGVTLENLIRLDKSMELRDLNAFSVAAKNVRVINGKINRCDLKSVSDEALWMKHGSQYIPSRVHVKYLTIDGNLEMESFNGAYTSDLINFLQIASTSEKENVIFGNLKTQNLYIAGTVNDIGIRFILQDCVQNSKYQILRGTKIFKHIKAKTVMADILESKRTCGIDVSEMYKLSINRSNDKYLYLENLVLPALNATIIKVKGKINGLTIPEDVVLTDSNEMIEDEVTLDILNAPAGLKVLGMVAGIDLENFINRRITLNESENISSEITFQNDSVIEGDCSIKTINGISFNNIVNGVQNQVITGRKNFAEDLMVLLDVKVKGTVDYIDIQNLLRNIVRRSANESFKDVVHFFKIIMPSLVCVTINGFNIGDVYDDTHLLYRYQSDKLDNFSSAFQSHRALMSKLDPTENSLLLYKWFELHKILDYGTIEKFLPVYEYGTHGPKYELETVQMVMWVKGKRRGMKSIIADIMKDGTIVKTNQIDGKVFPIFCSSAAGFFIQETNAVRCTRKECNITVTLYTSGKWKNTTIQSSNSGTILDVQLFEVEEMVFLIMSFSNAGSSERIIVYQYETDSSTWVLHQKFHMQDMTSFTILEVELDETSLFHVPSLYLAVTGDEQYPGVTIYEWDEEFIHVSNISTSVSTYATWVYNDRALHLLLAKEKDIIRKENDVSVNIFNEPLEVYTMEDELLLTQTVNVKGVSFLETFAFKEETFVLATSKHFGTVYVLQFRGYNGLELVQEIPSPGVTETRVFTVGNHLYLALNSVNSRVSSSPDRSPLSRILRASARGRIQEDTVEKKDPIKLFV